MNFWKVVSQIKNFWTKFQASKFFQEIQKFGKELLKLGRRVFFRMKLIDRNRFTASFSTFFEKAKAKLDSYLIARIFLSLRRLVFLFRFLITSQFLFLLLGVRRMSRTLSIWVKQAIEKSHSSKSSSSSSQSENPLAKTPEIRNEAESDFSTNWFQKLRSWFFATQKSPSSTPPSKARKEEKGNVSETNESSVEIWPKFREQKTKTYSSSSSFSPNEEKSTSRNEESNVKHQEKSNSKLPSPTEDEKNSSNFEDSEDTFIFPTVYFRTRALRLLRLIFK